MKSLYDPVRKLWVVATPEEVVRQTTLRWMIEQGGFDPRFLMVERLVGFGISRQTRRLDIAYAVPKSLTTQPSIYLIVECKAHFTGAKQLEEAKRQVLGYQWQLPSLGAAIVDNQSGWYCWTSKPEQWIEGIPTARNIHEYLQRAVN